MSYVTKRFLYVTRFSIQDLSLDCSQSPIFQWDRPDRALWSLTPAPSVHLKIKMAAINGETRYITTISRKNRGLWTVYALLNSSRHDPLHTVAHGCSGPIASITKWYNKFKQNRLNAEHNVSLLLLCVCSKRPMKLAHQQICLDL